MTRHIVFGHICLNSMVTEQILEEAYHRGEDGDVKERLLLVMRVKSDCVMASEASKELHRTRGLNWWGRPDLNRHN